MKGRPDPAEEARQWAVTWSLICVAVALAGIGVVVPIRHGWR
jgi:hypothetical protein